MESFRNDLKQVLRRLGRAPMFTVITLITLAAGVGANTVVFSDQNRTLQDLGLYAGDSVSVTGVAEPEQVRALRVTDGTLPLLGMPPLLGRIFTKQDDSPGA